MDVNYHVARIISNCFVWRDYQFRWPSRFRRYLAEETYCQVYQEALYNDSYTQEDYKEWLIANNIWNQEKEDNLQELKDDIDELKYQLYQNRHLDKTVDRIRRKLIEGKEKLGELLSKKHEYDYLTCEHVAQAAKDKFILGAGLIRAGKYYWKNPLQDWRNSDTVIEQVYDYWVQTRLNHDNIRDIAKSATWRSYWTIKGRMIDIFVVDMSDEMRDLFFWSQMYDSISKHPDAPPLDDNDILDGWLIMQHKQNRQAKLERKADEYASKHKSGEIFIPVSKKLNMSAKDIHDMNSTEGKEILRERRHVIKQKGVAHDLDMPDVLRDLSQQSTNQQRSAYGQK